MSPDPSLLAGLTVLDFSRVLAGPYCTRLLADLGARVIKVERPAEGDEVRRGAAQLVEVRNDQSSYFIRINVGKLGVAIDLAQPKGREVALDLVRVADVVVENFAPGVMTRLGCDYATASAIKPDLVYCSISGFGQTGPLASMTAFAHIINAMSGLMDLEREPDPHPRVSYLQAADVLAGTHAFGAILAALLRRNRTGAGAWLDVSMLECLVSAEDVTFGSVLNGGPVWPGPRPGMIVHRIGQRELAMQTVGAPQLWSRLLGLMGRPELNDDPRFATPIARRQNWPALREIIVDWLGRFASVDEAVQTLTRARLPAVPVLSPQEVIEHPHMIARGAFAEVPHPARGRVRVTATPVRVDGQAPGPRGPAPYRVGEHTHKVLTEILGYAPERIDELCTLGAIE
ncbi:MAG TPA: CaiB/BaiF CoA-transferase family protein, partial [Methylomirabilota bacterium]|nr:CaiB/BaiF CoA-transferase family protein [Methylomirabilota bacterium]